jgi:uncharacterized membrane protein
VIAPSNSKANIMSNKDYHNNQRSVKSWTPRKGPGILFVVAVFFVLLLIGFLVVIGNLAALSLVGGASVLALIIWYRISTRKKSGD